MPNVPRPLGSELVSQLDIVSISVRRQTGNLVLGHSHPSHRSGIVHPGLGQEGTSVDEAVASVTILGVRKEDIRAG